MDIWKLNVSYNRIFFGSHILWSIFFFFTFQINNATIMRIRNMIRIISNKKILTLLLKEFLFINFVKW